MISIGKRCILRNGDLIEITKKYNGKFYGEMVTENQKTNKFKDLRFLENGQHWNYLAFQFQFNEPDLDICHVLTEFTPFNKEGGGVIYESLGKELKYFKA